MERDGRVGAWVERLLRAEVPALREKQRFWRRVWILRFLSFCREPARDGFERTVLAKGYLRSFEVARKRGTGSEAKRSRRCGCARALCKNS